MEKLYNLTGKPVAFVLNDGSVREYPPEDFSAKEVREEVSWNDTSGVPTTRWLWHISGLPIPQDGAVYIVTPMVLSVAALMGRTTKDLRSPAAAVPDSPGTYRVLIGL